MLRIYREESIVKSFSLLWDRGYCPELRYKEEWLSEKTTDEVLSWYKAKALSLADLSEDKLMDIEDFIRFQEVDGKVRETINTTLVTIYWRVDI